MQRPSSKKTETIHAIFCFVVKHEITANYCHKVSINFINIKYVSHCSDSVFATVLSFCLNVKLQSSGKHYEWQFNSTFATLTKPLFEQV